MKLFKSRKFRQGSLATLLTVVGVAVIILLISVLSTVSDRFKLQADMTKEQIFTITDDTKDFLGGVSKDVTVYVLNSEDGFTSSAPATYFVQASEIIKGYEDLSPHIKVKYVDIVKDPGFVSQYPDLALNRNNILLVSGERTFLIEPTDLFNIQQTQQGAYVSSSKAEQTMTSAILAVTSEEQIVATFITGHDEESLPGFANLLAMNNYHTTSTNLLTEEIDPAVTIAILAAPARDLTEEELKKLDAFLRNNDAYGKTLLYTASMQQPEMAAYPNLAAFLAEWGLAVGEGLVFETDTSRITSPLSPYFFIVNYIDNDLQPAMKSQEFFNSMNFVKPVEILFGQGNGKTTYSMLETSDKSGVPPLNPPEDWSVTEEDLNGPYSTFAISSYLKYEGTTPQISNVAVLGTTEALSDAALGQVSFANSEYFLAVLDSLVDKDDHIRIQPKELDTYAMNISAGQAYLLGAIFMILLPLTLFITGLVIWIRRRHK